MNFSTYQIWLIILGMALGTFLIRFSFLGIFGRRDIPVWLLRILRYTPVAVIPALVAPLVVWPQATGGAPDLARALAAVVALLIGLVTRNVLVAMTCGGGVLLVALRLL